MKARKPILIGIAVVAIVAASVGLPAVMRAVKGRLGASQVKATYYCPMHPTYTSDRPGECPICHMSLVKAEPASSSLQPPASSLQRTSKDICYLHNCPMAHEGKPCPMTVVAKTGEKVICPICGTHITESASTGQRKILYWTDPMIPGYTADGPGKSPMGMDLVPVYEEAAGRGSGMAGGTLDGYAPVLLTPQKQQVIGITTAQVMRRRLVKTIRTVGRIAYDPELYQAQQEYLQAQVGAQRAVNSAVPQLKEQSDQLVQSSRLRLRLLGMSDALIDEMGTWSGPDRSLLLADSSKRAWIYANVYEYELPLITMGQSVRIELPSVAGRTLVGTVRSIDPVLDAQTRSAKVRAVVTDAEGWFKPEMFVNVYLEADLGEVLAVPHEAVFATGERSIVFVDQGQGLFVPRDVVVGASADGYDEVKSGAAEGESVVTSGNFLIDSESRLQAAIHGAAQPGHQHGQ